MGKSKGQTFCSLNANDLIIYFRNGPEACDVLLNKRDGKREGEKERGREREGDRDRERERENK